MSAVRYVRLSSILRLQATEHEARIQFWCPGCDDRHEVRTQGPNPWTWNGDVEKPTFYPSVATECRATVKDAEGRWTGEHVRDAQGLPVELVCHSFVEEGRIRYLSDCTHALVNQTVDLPEWYTHETDGLPGRPPKISP